MALRYSLRLLAVLACILFLGQGSRVRPKTSTDNAGQHTQNADHSTPRYISRKNAVERSSDGLLRMRQKLRSIGVAILALSPARSFLSLIGQSDQAREQPVVFSGPTMRSGASAAPHNSQLGEREKDVQGRSSGILAAAFVALFAVVASTGVRNRRCRVTRAQDGRVTRSQDGPELAGTAGPDLKYIFWAAAVGASVSMRLWCSVKLTSNALAMDPLAASCHVAARTMLLSALFLVPFSSLRGLPRTKEPWLSGLTTLPVCTFITSSRLLGLGLSQMILKFSTLASALALDTLASKVMKGIRRRLIGLCAVLAGVALGLLGTGVFGLNVQSDNLPLLLVCLLGTLATGAGYVLQARLATPTEKSPSVIAGACSSEQAEATSALVCQLTSALAQVFLIAVLSMSSQGNVLNFPSVQVQDLPFWVFEGVQGAFYLRSMQLVPSRIGYATAFTFSLSGQLLTAACIDFLGGATLSLSRVAGLALVIFGAVYSATSEKAKSSS